MPLENYHGKGGPLDLPPYKTTLWRYMDFARFMALLVDGLYLRRVDCLDDRFEGFVPDYHPPRFGFRELIEFDKKRVAKLKDESKTASRNYYVSCWHGNDDESDAMWKLYVKGDGGLAIRTTPERLKKALFRTPKKLWYGNVTYYDPKEGRCFDSMVHLVMAKRKAFEHERECRLIWLDEQSATRKTENPPVGTNVRCKVKELIETVVIAPNCPWFKPIIEDVLVKYGFDLPVVQSDVLIKPHDD